MNMRDPAAPVYLDVRSQIRANYALILGVLEHELNICTTLSKDVWSAHLVRVSGCTPMEPTAIVSQSGATTEQAFWKLYIASATQGHPQNFRTGGVKPVNIDKPVALRGDNKKKDHIYHDNGDSEFDSGSDDDRESQTSEGDFQAPEINPGPRLLHPTGGAPGMGPFLSGVDQPPPDNVRICITFVNYRKFDIVERVSLKTEDVVLAATRACSTLVDTNFVLHGSLKSVSVGGTTISVEEGCVSDLAAVIKGMSAKGGGPILGVEGKLPILGVEVTKVSGGFAR